MRPRTSRSARASAPSTRTVPCVGGVSPHITRNSVDLPAPFGPSNAVTPGPTENVTSDTATTSPNDLVTFVTATIGLPRAQVRASVAHHTAASLR